MDLSSLPDLTAYIPDIVLILISGSAGLYCATLSRRLKNLNNLKTGVGASIVSLTEAIEDTHKAAQEAQNSTLQTVETLRHLLEKSESAAPKIEALISELERSCDTVKIERRKLERDIDVTLTPATEKAQKTASALLKIVSDVEKYKNNINSKTTTAKNAPPLLEVVS